MSIGEYIATHWVEWLFCAITFFAGVGYRNVTKKLTEERSRNEAIADGVQSLLRQSIVNDYNKYKKDKGYCPIYAKESIKSVYSAYHKLGGNDIATGLYHEILEMQTEPEV